MLEAYVLPSVPTAPVPNSANHPLHRFRPSDILRQIPARHRVVNTVSACMQGTIVPQLSRRRDLPAVLACWRGFPNSTRLGRRRCTSLCASDSMNTSAIETALTSPSPHSNPSCTDRSQAGPINVSHPVISILTGSSSLNLYSTSTSPESTLGSESVTSGTSCGGFSTIQAGNDPFPSPEEATLLLMKGQRLVNVGPSGTLLDGASMKINTDLNVSSKPGGTDASDQHQSPLLSSSSLQPPASGKELPRSPLAIALEPTDGSVPLWWVEHFESRRQVEHQSGTSPVVAFTNDSERKQPVFLMLLGAVARSMSAIALAAALVIWPASNVPQGLDIPAVWGLFLKYMAFAVSWNMSKGTEQKYNSTGPSLARQAARSVFFLAIGLCHWLPMLRFANMQLAGPASGMTAYDVAGNVGIFGAIALNLWTARSSPKASQGAVSLEQQQKRLALPTWMIMCISYALAVHSAPTALLMVLICACYHKSGLGVDQRLSVLTTAS